MKQLFLIMACLLLGLACTEKKDLWQIETTINLGEITPIGFVFQGDNIWIADGDHNQIVEINTKGDIQRSFSDFERPMHLDTDGETLYIPEYGADRVVKLSEGKRQILELPDSLDAPAGVSVLGKEMAIADFYKHRILYFDGQKWTSFGEEGKAEGQLYYPTDVQILADKIVVADAYNNRVQLFDKSGTSIGIIGAADNLNAATGVFANETEVFVTDFEHDRVLIYDYKGAIQQVISEKVDKPTDILVQDGVLYIANYKAKNILTLSQVQ